MSYAVIWRAMLYAVIWRAMLVTVEGAVSVTFHFFIFSHNATFDTFQEICVNATINFHFNVYSIFKCI